MYCFVIRWASGKIRKRGCSSSASSSSSIIQNYRFKREILVGKRGGSNTQVPTRRHRVGRQAEMDGMFNVQVALRRRSKELERGLKEMLDEKEGLEQQLQVVLMNYDIFEAWLSENEGKTKDGVDVMGPFSVWMPFRSRYWSVWLRIWLLKILCICWIRQCKMGVRGGR